MRILKKKKKRNKGKTDIEEREQKRVSVQKHVRLKKEIFFKKKERERQTCKDMYFLFKEKLTKKWKDKKRRSFQMRVLERGHRQRKQKKEKENTCGRNEKTRREKRDNRWRNGWTKGWL